MGVPLAGRTLPSILFPRAMSSTPSSKTTEQKETLSGTYDNLSIKKSPAPSRHLPILERKRGGGGGKVLNIISSEYDYGTSAVCYSRKLLIESFVLADFLLTVIT